jgi:integration host factor subunit alpha
LKVLRMAGRTITRAQLSESVYQEVGLSRNESADLLEMVLSEIASALTRGESVKISSFGSFSIRSKGQRVGRNPKTGEEVPILPRRVLVFRPSQLLKSRINEGIEAAEAAGGTSGPSGTSGAAPASGGSDTSAGGIKRPT